MSSWIDYPFFHFWVCYMTSIRSWTYWGKSVPVLVLHFEFSIFFSLVETLFIDAQNASPKMVPSEITQALIILEVPKKGYFKTSKVHVLVV